MKKAEKLMQIRYNEKEDQFELWILGADGEWGYGIGCKCLHRAGREDEEANYIHYSILNEIKRALSYGYKLIP